MTKKHRLSFLLIGPLLLVMVGFLAACKAPEVPTDQDIIKAYQDNHKEFGEVVEKMMAEPNKKFAVGRDRSVTYQAGDKPPISDKTSSACQQIMRRTFCLSARRHDGLAQFVFFEDNNSDVFRSKSLLYDGADFSAPVWSAKSTDTLSLRYTPVEPNWRVEYRYEKKAKPGG
jgi:hypothetical protein